MEIREGDRAAALQETTHLHNFVVQNHTLCCAEPHTLLYRTTHSVVQNHTLRVRKITNNSRLRKHCTTSLYRTTHSVCGK